MPPGEDNPLVPVFRRPRFIEDLTEAYSYLAERNASSADQLLDEVELLVDLLAAFPAIGRPRRGTACGCPLIPAPPLPTCRILSAQRRPDRPTPHPSWREGYPA